jgi:hypothetical protein
MINLENIEQKALDEQSLWNLIQEGITPELNSNEIDAIVSGYKGNFLSLLSENLIIHKRNALTIIITKTLSEDLNVPDYMKNVLSCIKFDCWVQIGS